MQLLKTLIIVLIPMVGMNAQVIEADTSGVITPTVTEGTSKKLKDNPYGVFSIFSGNPGKAALFSLVLPGAGQVYNKRYWKVPLVLAAEGAAIYVLSDAIKTYQLWDTDYKNIVQGIPAIQTEVQDITFVKSRRDSFRQNKDQMWLLAIGVHLIVVADAFVDRHLLEFDVSDDISLNIIVPHNMGITALVTF